MKKVRSLTPSARGNAMKNRGAAPKFRPTASSLAKAKAQGKVTQRFGKGPIKGVSARSQIKGMPGKSLKGRRPMLGGKKGTR